MTSSGRNAAPLRLVTLVVAALAVVLVLGACSDSSGETSTVGTVVFGDGEIPRSFPDEFPIPEGTRVGKTLVDGINVRTEVELRVPSDVPEVADFFVQRLPQAGFTVDSSEQSPTRWTITFSDGDLAGEIDLTSPTIGISIVVVEVNRA